jgi:hypothetical protein
MTKKDAWQMRAGEAQPRVLQWFAFKDAFRLTANTNGYRGERILTLNATAYFAFNRGHARGAPHMQRPDSSNVQKAIEDALTDKDETIYDTHFVKRWDDGHGERIEIELGLEETVQESLWGAGRPTKA